MEKPSQGFVVREMQGSKSNHRGTRNLKKKMGLFVYGLQSQQIKIPVQQSLLHIISSTFPLMKRIQKVSLHLQSAHCIFTQWLAKKKPAHCENSINFGLTSLHYIEHFGILLHR